MHTGPLDPDSARARRAWTAALLYAALLPALLLAPVLGGRALWVHAHDGHAEHFHLVPAAELHGPQDLAHWHEHRHHAGDEEHPHEDLPREPGVELPAQLHAQAPLALIGPPAGAPGKGSSAAAFASTLLSGACARWHVAWIDGTHREELRRSGWPPQRAARTSVVALLQSSHALRI